MGRRLGEFEWVKTPMGDPGGWPKSLHSTIRTILGSRYPMILLWGQELIQLYNDAYIGLIGAKHPDALGRSIRETQAESWDAIGPMIREVMSTGNPNWVPAQRLPLMRSGYLEESHFSLSYSAVDDDDGAIAGMLCVCSEVTPQVVGERRMQLLRELGAATEAGDPKLACQLVGRIVSRYPLDVPFAALYLKSSEGRALELCGASHLAERRDLPERVELGVDSSSIWPFARAMKGETVRVDELHRHCVHPAGPFSDALRTALVMPIVSVDPCAPLGLMVAAVSPARALDEAYRTFYELFAGKVSTVVRHAQDFDEARKRAEALAEVDRVKTAFFGNVSHEFRTPLTLILGPIEDALARPEKVLHTADLQAVHRSALRLLRLVNSLLAFSRMEAGRLQSCFEPTDLAALTAGLAGSFQSLIESAGLRLTVDCTPLPEPVYVDRSQWEKIVLNLVSNAFKFTFEGEIKVLLRARGERVELSVRDTGTGIELTEQPRIFERFHRVEGAPGRSFEGTGIGLALVQELSKQHGGSVRLESAPGKGSVFVVSIPLGKDHLPKDQLKVGGAIVAETRDAAPYLLDASQWSVDRGPDPAVPCDGDPLASTSGVVFPNSAAPPRVLVAEDNADMRAYLVGLLSQKWAVEATGDGLAALEAARAQPPDLVLSDVMMPRMDGVELLRELRADPLTHTIPVVLLSARAGEDCVVDGLETGADDYLVKPFSARELMSRVGTHLEMARIRRAATDVANELARTRAHLLLDIQRKNAELEAFSYSVSHDLRAPLRSIDGFSQALLEDCADKLDDTGRKYLGFVRESAQLMAQLIDDMLTLARVTRSDVDEQTIDLSALARAACARLRRSDPDRDAEVVIESDLMAYGDSRLLSVALDNLLGNAWKFTRKRSRARIEFGATWREGVPTYFVRDNGAGFDMTYASKLFGVFQRLHAAHEFEGTGVGLATVQRIIERHRGSVWAEGGVDVGATFYFTLGEREHVA